MTKDQIIETQSKLILELLAIGKDKMQEVTDLFCKIQRIPKGIENVNQPPEPEIDRRNVLEIKKHRELKEGKLCPRCKSNQRLLLRSGKYASYCSRCSNEKAKEKREDNPRRTYQQRQSLDAQIQAMEINV